MAGALAVYLLMRKAVSRREDESAGKDMLLERLREELNAANMKLAQAEERCSLLKSAVETEKQNAEKMVAQVKELNEYALENIANDDSDNADSNS